MNLYRKNFPRKLLHEIRRRPGMYLIPANSFSSLINFISGFEVGCRFMNGNDMISEPQPMLPLKLDDDFLGFFSLWCQRTDDTYGSILGYWNGSWGRGGNDDKKSFHAFFQLMDEFDADLQKYGENLVIAELLSWQKEQEEKVGHWDE